MLADRDKSGGSFIVLASDNDGGPPSRWQLMVDPIFVHRGNRGFSPEGDYNHSYTFFYFHIKLGITSNVLLFTRKSTLEKPTTNKIDSFRGNECNIMNIQREQAITFNLLPYS